MKSEKIRRNVLAHWNLNAQNFTKISQRFRKVFAKFSQRERRRPSKTGFEHAHILLTRRSDIALQNHDFTTAGFEVREADQVLPAGLPAKHSGL